MPGEYIPILMFAILVASVPAVGFALARRASGDDSSSDTHVNAANGRPRIEETERRRNSSRIFLVGALFVACEVLVIFMLPWAVRIGELGVYGLAAIGGFLGVLTCGYIWLYKNRALERL